MASIKNNFLNAKPVSKLGGKSGGVRKPSKPYAKPPAKPKAEKPARWDAKTKTERLQEAAKTKPKSPAPRQVTTKPVTRTGPVKGPVPPKGSSPAKLPNSSRAGTNLPKVGARAERTAARVADLKKASAPKPSATAPKPTAVSGAGMAGRLAGAFGTALAIPAAIKNIADVAERNRQWDAYKERMGMNKPQAKPSTSSSSTPGRRTGQNDSTYTVKTTPGDKGSSAQGGGRGSARSTRNKPAPSGPDWRSRVNNADLSTLRQGQDDAIRSYNNKPAPKPQASRPAGTQPSRPAASRPTAPAKPASPAAPKDRRVSAATANRESGNYGTSRTNNPMIDDAMKARMRQREESQAGASGSSKPEDKSRYVASDGRQYKGPAFGNEAKSSNTASTKYKPAEKGMTLAERLRQRRRNIA